MPTTVNADRLKKEFSGEVLAAAKTTHSNYLLREMLHSGPYESVCRWLDSGSHSSGERPATGFLATIERGQWRQTYEAIVLRQRYEPIFTSEQRAKARQRLRDAEITEAQLDSID